MNIKLLDGHKITVHDYNAINDEYIATTSVEEGDIIHSLTGRGSTRVQAIEAVLDEIYTFYEESENGR